MKSDIETFVCFDVWSEAIARHARKCKIYFCNECSHCPQSDRTLRDY